jgi:hypothetical protein
MGIDQQDVKAGQLKNNAFSVNAAESPKCDSVRQGLSAPYSWNALD